MKRWRAILALVLLVGVLVLEGVIQSVHAQSACPVIRADQLAAVAVALHEFESRKPVLSDYTVEAEDGPDETVVIFLPKRSPAEMEIRGGRTAAGEEIHFHVATDTLRVKRVTFGR